MNQPSTHNFYFYSFLLLSTSNGGGGCCKFYAPKVSYFRVTFGIGMIFTIYPPSSNFLFHVIDLIDQVVTYL